MLFVSSDTATKRGLAYTGLGSRKHIASLVPLILECASLSCLLPSQGEGEGSKEALPVQEPKTQLPSLQVCRPGLLGPGSMILARPWTGSNTSVYRAGLAELGATVVTDVF